ncbi:hypothetical protein B0A48_08206 [Cryoendolithus antarcticus]|uniref:Conserved oligomeric Golgi complex subunit 3 n=1 Tax=Cryoendolithus antarcticus TaxID=1507870 RepID=A0A1V8T1A8_9PEZI|nr:hypothetical protein B0A48_08206 [Cryoendolithus antarcticus]
MDDAWFHTLTSTAAQPSKKEKPAHARRASLLQQPVDKKADTAIEVITEVNEDVNTLRAGPPKATLGRRAQSYSDFYYVATARSSQDTRHVRKRSLDSQRYLSRHRDAELAFEDEVAEVEDRLLEESHAEYEAYAQQLQLTDSHLTNLLESTSDTLAILASLSSSFAAVKLQTDAFRKQCESLITEQRRLSTLADGIEENARYYTYLEPMTRRLNAPGAASLVQGGDFPSMLSSLDNCLAYMEAHPKQLESATYRAKYRLLLTRALTLIRHHFTRSLGDLANDIAKRIQSGQLKATTHSALLYAKFRVPAPELKALGLEIQKRAVPTPDDVDAGREPEYTGLMRELYESYSTTRGRLVLPLVTRRIAETAADPQQSDVLDLSKSAIAYMRSICLDEHDLWYEWFETVGALYDFLETLMDPMYDYLRPRIIHETKVEKLCQLCASLQGRYMDNESDEEDSDADSRVASPVGNGRPVMVRRLDFGVLIQPALEDAQTRLVFLALTVLRDGIEGYKPKPADLEWPKRLKPTANGKANGPALSGRRASTGLDTAATPTDPTSEAGFGQSPAQHTGNWYPTLPTALHLLRSIYRLIHSSVFDDLAHRIVHSTTLSLLSASNRLSSPPNLGTPQKASSHLFLLAHLLHLKHQLVTFDLETLSQPDVDLDFSSLSLQHNDLRVWNPATWIRFVSSAVVGGNLLPRVVENMLDAKAELDGRLRGVIGNVVEECALEILGPLSLTDPAIATAGGSDKAVHELLSRAETLVPELSSLLASFFPAEDTAMEQAERARNRATGVTLLQAVKERVQSGYEEFFERMAGRQPGRKVGRKGKGREGDVLGPDVFGERLDGVFANADRDGDLS